MLEQITSDLGSEGLQPTLFIKWRIARPACPLMIKGGQMRCTELLYDTESSPLILLTILKSYMAFVSDSSWWGGTWKYSMSLFSSISTFASKFTPLSEIRRLYFSMVFFRCTSSICAPSAGVCCENKEYAHDLKRYIYILVVKFSLFSTKVNSSPSEIHNFV